LHVLSLPPAFVLSQDQTLKLKEFDLDYVTTLILTEHLHLWVSPQRCTHQSIDQVDVYSIRSIRTGARTPPPTLLFSSQQCQRAPASQRQKKETSAEQTLFPTEVGRNSPVSEEVLGAVRISSGVDGRYIGRTLLACQRACESFLTGRSPPAGRPAAQVFRLLPHCGHSKAGSKAVAAPLS
jgi:hypothetical protein